MSETCDKTPMCCTEYTIIVGAVHTLATVSYVTIFCSVCDARILSTYHRKRFISCSVFNVLNYMYAERLLEHFRFLRDRPTLCGAKTSRHGRNGILGTFLGHCVTKINKSKIYP